MLGRKLPVRMTKQSEIVGKTLPTDLELIDVVDEQGNLIESRSFREVHDLGLLHRFCRVLLMNSQGDFILHIVDSSLRNAGKYDAPGGHLDAGETYEQAAVREVFEEMGVRIDEAELIYLGKIEERNNPSHENMIGRAFVAVHDGPYTAEEGEVEAVYAVSEEELSKEIVKNKKLFTTKLLQTFRLWENKEKGDL